MPLSRRDPFRFQPRSGAARSLLAGAGSAGAFGCEALEPRALMYAFTPGEVYLTELINRARTNPMAEAARLGINLNSNLTLGEQQLLLTPKEPLALSAALSQSARAHAADMPARGFFSHVNPDNLNPTARAQAAGYVGTAGENIGGGFGTIDELYRDWMLSPEQRRNVLSINIWFDATFHYDEFGPGFAIGVSGAAYSNYYVGDFGNPATSARGQSLVGVVFADGNGNQFYDISEGRGGIRVDVFSGSSTTGSPVATQTTSDAGNYQIRLGSGSYTVVYTDIATGNFVAKPITIGAQNIKMDARLSEFAPPPPPPDDHANSGQWSQATGTPVDPVNGNAANIGRLAHAGDTDLFKFVASKAGSALIVAAPVNQGPGQALSVQLRVFSAVGTLLASGAPSQAGGRDSSAEVPLVSGQTYYVLVQAATGSASSTGDYAFTMRGPIDPPPTDDHADEGEVAQATGIAINQTSASGVAAGSIEVLGDTDLFRFTAVRTGESIIVGLPVGNTFAVEVRLLSSSGALLATSSPSSAGGRDGRIVAALTTGQSYFLAIQARGAQATGSYTATITGPDLVIDDHANEGQLSQATTVAISPETAGGSSQGIIGEAGDTDIFRFTAARQGSSVLSVLPTGATFAVRLRLFSADGVLLATGSPSADGARDARLTQSLDAGQVYYVVVEARGAQATGSFALAIVGPAPSTDDHADNGEWNQATVVSLSPDTASGATSGVIGEAGDSDAFQFVALRSGQASISGTPVSGQLAARLRLFDAAGTLVATGSPSAGGSLDSWLSASLQAGQSYYLVLDGQQAAQTGAYTITITGPDLPPPPDDHADAGAWANATSIELDLLTANGSDEGELEVDADTDLFRFVAGKSGLTTLRTQRSPGTVGAPLLLKLYSGTGELIATGVPTGASVGNSQIQFEVVLGQTYFLLVEAASAGRANYGLDVIAPVPTEPLPQFRTASGAPVDTTYIGGRPTMAFVNQDGRSMFVERTSAGVWSTVDLSQFAAGESVVGTLRLWFDPRDGSTYVAGASTSGVLLFERNTSGVWTRRNLTTEVRQARPIASSITIVADGSGLWQIAGLASDGSLVTYFQNGRRVNGDWRFGFTDVGARDLRLVGKAMPRLSSAGLSALASSAGTLNIVGTNLRGEVLLFTRNQGGLNTQLWNFQNLTRLTRSALLTGGLSASESTTGTMTISGIDASGRVWMLTNRASEGWRGFNVTSRVAGSQQIVAGSIATFSNTNGVVLISGITQSGLVVLYRYQFRVNTSAHSWSFATVSGAISNPPLVAGATRMAVQAGQIMVSASTGAGDITRLVFTPSLGWASENVSRLLAG